MSPDRLLRHDHPPDDTNVTWGDMRELTANATTRADAVMHEVNRALHLLYAMIGVLVVLVLGAITAAVVIGNRQLDTVANVKRNSETLSQSVCAIVVYAEQQSTNIRDRADMAPAREKANLFRSAGELAVLAQEMRQTGIRCPPDARP